MKLKHLWIEHYKNLRDCKIEFSYAPLINAIVGSNGSGKSNLIEVILQILIGIFLKEPPKFIFDFEFDAQNRNVAISNKQHKLKIAVDQQYVPLDRFVERLHDGPAQVVYPELTLTYYSGECQRISKLVHRYTKHFQSKINTAESDSLRPLFVQTTNEQVQLILLALFAHRHDAFLARLGLSQIIDLQIQLQSPTTFDSNKHEPKLWNTTGATRKTIAAIDETADAQARVRLRRAKQTRQLDSSASKSSEEPPFYEIRTYKYTGSYDSGLNHLARRFSTGGDNVYLSLEGLRLRGILKSVDFRLQSNRSSDTFSIDQLSEGEKQLISVVGAILLINQKDNLVLLDEPDTHLNPQWSWDYPEILLGAFDNVQGANSTVLMTTHDPVMISGMKREQVLVARQSNRGRITFAHPYRNPRGQGVANILSSSEFFGLPSSLDKETQKLLDERLAISLKETLSKEDKSRLKELNGLLEILSPGVSERDPRFVEFLNSRQPKP